MLGPKPFEKITYKEPKTRPGTRKEIERFIGVDSEAYRDGIPFLFCSSEGDAWVPKNIPECFFDDKFAGASFVLFNMKYDAGALLRCFCSHADLKVLARYGEVDVDEYQVKYIPHKYLCIRQGKVKREWWDIAQFYHSSLDAAAKKYLGEEKIEVETKSFTRRYVKKNWDHLVKYCIHDAWLTARLADYFKTKLNEFGIECCALYSPASLSATYMHAQAGMVDIWDSYRLNRDAVRAAHESYQGGKFECTRLGSFHGWEYDIVSAYPREMANLIDIRGANWVYSDKVQAGATYAWLRVRIHHTDQAVPPCHGLLVDGVRVYAHGTYYCTITLEEYRYLTGSGIEVKIISGWWCFTQSTARPYKKVIEYLFQIKDTYRADPMLYSLAKIMMNGYYGKLANLLAKHVECDVPELADDFGEETIYEAGVAWNPFYASMITANTRIAVCKVQQYLGEDCVATHTDSVMTTRPLPPGMLGTALGDLKFEAESDGLIILSGLYDFDGHSACRGFEMKDGFSWRALLERHPRATFHHYDQRRVVSWTQATAWDRIEETNQFQSMPKKINLNADAKREWLVDPIKAHHLLKGLIQSQPRIVTERNNPFTKTRRWD